MGDQNQRQWVLGHQAQIQVKIDNVVLQGNARSPYYLYPTMLNMLLRKP